MKLLFILLLPLILLATSFTTKIIGVTDGDTIVEITEDKTANQRQAWRNTLIDESATFFFPTDGQEAFLPVILNCRMK